MNNYIQLILLMLCSLVLVTIIMPFWIKFLKKHDANQQVSEYALAEFQAKAKTPTFGGFIFIIVTLVLSIGLAVMNQSLDQAYLVIASLFLFGLVGFIDDYLIVIRHNNLGLSPRLKLLMQVGSAIILVCASFFTLDSSVHFLGLNINLGLLYIPFMVFVFVGSSNAVNLTDGMDGLAAGCALLVTIGFEIIALIQGANLMITGFLAILAGSLIGYLFFNMHPAKIFMGDTGSLALGGVFAAIAIELNQELAYIFIGGVFVWETVCVMLQQFWVRRFKKRLFIYTPIHYAFTKRGWKETSTVSFFYCICCVCVCVGVVIALFS